MSKNIASIIISSTLIFSFLGCSSEKTPNTSTGNTTIEKNTTQQQKSPADMTSRELVDVCTTDMATQFHIHSHLTIMADKKTIVIPKNVGIDLQKNCMSSVHTHDANGIIHIEAPVQKDFTLGDFFYKWNMPLSRTQVLTLKTDDTHGLKIYADGKEITDPENLVMTDHQDIFISYYALKDGPDPLPAPFDWSEE